jgi:hypothetical protein
LERWIHDHETRLAVVQSCQVNTAERLDEIRKAMQETNEKMEHVLVAVSKHG